jgi:integrase
MPKVNLMLSARLGGKWRFFRASIAGNGRVEPGVAIVNDRRRTIDSSSCGGYFVRYTKPNGKQTYEPAGKGPATARARQIAKQAELESKKAGVRVSVENPDQKKTYARLADSIAEYNNFIKENRRKKTWMAYKNALAYFARFCDENGVQTLHELRGRKGLILKFPKFVMANGNGEATAFNNFANLMIFLRWAGIETGIKKSEWPERPERNPEEYSDEELTAMLKAANAEERLVLKSFLLSGFRSGEIAHMTYERIDFDTSVWKVRKNDEWGWKPKKKASNRDVPVHPDLTKRIAERMKARNAEKTELIFPNGVSKPNMHLLRIVKRVAKRAGITDIRVDDHKFRSTAVTRWLREGYTVPEVVQMAGHSDMATIMRYAAKLNVTKKEHRAKADKAASKFVNIGD